MSFSDWMKQISLLNTAMSVLISGAVGYYAANWNDAVSKARSMQVEELGKFSTNYAVALSDVMDYIGSTARSEDRQSAQKALASQVSKLLVESQGLERVFHSQGLRADIASYQQNLQDFSAELRSNPDSAGMVRWAEKFDRFNNASRSLANKLQSSIGLPL